MHYEVERWIEPHGIWAGYWVPLKAAGHASRVLTWKTENGSHRAMPKLVKRQWRLNMGARIIRVADDGTREVVLPQRAP